MIRGGGRDGGVGKNNEVFAPFYSNVSIPVRRVVLDLCPTCTKATPVAHKHSLENEGFRRRQTTILRVQPVTSLYRHQCNSFSKGVGKRVGTITSLIALRDSQSLTLLFCATSVHKMLINWHQSLRRSNGIALPVHQISTYGSVTQICSK